MVWTLLLFGAPIFLVLEGLIHEVSLMERKMKSDDSFKNPMEKQAVMATLDTMRADRKRMRRLFLWYYLVANVVNIIYSYV